MQAMFLINVILPLCMAVIMFGMGLSLLVEDFKRILIYPKAAALLLDAETDILVYKTFPNEHWRRIHSTNLLERLNREIKRRTKVVGVFPDQPSVIRLVGTLLMDTDDDWRATQRKYFSLESMQLLTNSDKSHVLEPSSFLVDLTTTITAEA